MDLVRDVLDKSVVDRQGQPMGRVDDVVLRVNDGAPPEVVGLDIGPVVVAARLARRMGAWAAALERTARLPSGRPVRIGVAMVARVAEHVQLTLDASETAAGAVEARLRRLLGAAVPPIGDGVRFQAVPLQPDEFHLSTLLSRTVRDGKDGRAVGRLEELRVDALPGQARVIAFEIGAAGLAERLGLTARLLIGPAISRGVTVGWRQLSCVRRDRSVRMTLQRDHAPA